MLAFVTFTHYSIVIGVSMECDYKEITLCDEKDLYTCDVKNSTFYESPSNITSIQGNHKTLKSFNDVKVLKMHYIPPLKHFPQNIANHLKNLTIIQVIYCSLQSITEKDLQPFVKLEHLYLHNNQLKRLEKISLNIIRTC